MNKHRFAVLDRDGTIIVDHPYSADPDRIEFLPGAERGLRMLRDSGIGLVVVTNQSGIGRGLFDEAALDLMHERFRERLQTCGIHLDGIYSCRHHPDDGCDCRKPETALLLRAAHDLGFDPSAAFVVGDKLSDVELGNRVGATTFLVTSGAQPGASIDPAQAPDHAVDDLPAVAEIVRSVMATEATAASSSGQSDS